MSIYSCLLPMYLLKKTILFFPILQCYILRITINIIERISSLYRGYLAAGIYTERPDPSQIEYYDEIKTHDI